MTVLLRPNTPPSSASTSDTTARLPKLQYFPYIDGLRAIAVLSVVIYHLNAAWLPGGFSGVDIFFVISGFIVSASVSAAGQLTILEFMAFFYARRVKRIMPALMVCLLITGFATAVLIPSSWLGNGNQLTGLYAFFGLSNFILAKTENDYFSPTTEFNPYTHTWSLGVEEQFYIIFPIIFFAWTLRKKWRLVTIGIFSALLLLSVVNAAWLATHNKSWAFYLITSRFWELAAGVLLFQIMTICGRRFDQLEQQNSQWFKVGAIMSLCLIGYGFVASVPSAFPFPGALPTVIGTLGLLYFLHGQTKSDPLVRIIGSRPLLFVGKISYSLYLWHWPVFVIFRWTVGLETLAHQMLAVGIAASLSIVSFYWIETPFRQLNILRRTAHATVVALGLAMVSACAFVAYGINYFQPYVSASVVSRHADDWYANGPSTDPALPGCSVKVIQTGNAAHSSYTYVRENCGPATVKNRVFVIGDSHALGYGSMFNSYVLQTGGHLTLFRNGGCPLISFQPVREATPECKKSIAQEVKKLLDQLAPGDIVFLPSLRLPRFSNHWVQYSDEQVDDEFFSEPAVRERALLEQEAIQLLRQFNAKGARLILEGPKPVFRSPAYRCAEKYNQSLAICTAGPIIERARIEELRKPILDAFERMASAVPNVTIWDPFPKLCPPSEQCSQYLNGRPLFFDGDHLSGYGNQLLLPSFIASISASAH